MADKENKTKRGRKSFVATSADRQKVSALAAQGLSHPVIAEDIGISVPTLRKNFAFELKARLAADNLFTAAGAAAPARPASPRPKRRGAGGRKSYEPTLADREKVTVLVAHGMGAEDIARALCLSEPTLRKHFAAELDTGAVRKRAEMLMALTRTALKGNVAAQKESLAIMEKTELARLQDRVRGTQDEAPPVAARAVEPPGKKVQAQMEAQRAAIEGPWADVLPFTPKSA